MRVIRLLVLVAMISRTLCNVTVSYSVREEVPVGTVVGVLSSHRSVQQLFSRTNGSTQAAFSLPKESAFFAVDELAGLIRTKSRIDRELLCEQDVATCCHLGHKHATSGRPECFIPLHVFFAPSKEFLQVFVTVNDINDHAPSFSQSEIATFVSENETPGQFCIDLPPAVDPDSTRFAVQDYRLEQSAGKFRLRVNDRPVTKYDDLCLLVDEHLDREKLSSYSLKVLAIDGGSPPQTGTLSVTIRVLDSNDNRPLFRNDSYVVRVPEDITLNSEIIQLHATDADEGEHGRVMYSFMASNTFVARGELSEVHQPAIVDRFGPFYINSDTGSITLDSQLDFEETRFYELRVLARDYGAQVPRFSTTSVMVHVTDVNDCPPEVELYPASLNGTLKDSLEVLENEPAGTLIGMIVVTDRDEHFELKPRCTSSTPNLELRRLEDSVNRFAIVTKVSFDREVLDRHHVTLRCHDGGSPPQTVDTTVTINVLDRNDNVPNFESDNMFIRVHENNNAGEVIGYLNFTDSDAGVSDAEFIVTSVDTNVSSSVITVRNGSGEVISNVVFDRERRETYRFRVFLRDPKAPRLTPSFTLLTIVVEDENDVAPIFEKTAYSFTVNENQRPQTLIGNIRAHDDDALHNGAVQYTLMHSHAAFSLTERGDLFALAKLDREGTSEYTLTAIAYDRGVPRLSSTVQLHIEVMDTNDNKPVFVWPSVRNNTLTVSTKAIPGPIGTVLATDNDGNENGWVSYSLLNAEDTDLLTIDERNGNLMLRRAFDETDRRVIRLMVKASDHGKSSLHETAVVNVHFVDLSLNGHTETPTNKESWNDVAVLVIVGFTFVSFVLLIVVFVFGCRRRSRQRLIAHDALNAESASDSDSSRSSAAGSVVSILDEVLVQPCTRVRGREQHEREDQGAATRLLSSWPAESPLVPQISVVAFRPEPCSSLSHARRASSAHRSNTLCKDLQGSESSLASSRSMSEECLSSAALRTTTQKSAQPAPIRPPLTRPATYPPYDLSTSANRRMTTMSAGACISPSSSLSSDERSRMDNNASRKPPSACNRGKVLFRQDSSPTSSANATLPPRLSTSSQPQRGTFV